MNVRELIAELQKFDQDAPVVVTDAEYGDVSFVQIDRKWVKIVPNPRLPNWPDVERAKEGDAGAVNAVELT